MLAKLRVCTTKEWRLYLMSRRRVLKACRISSTGREVASRRLSLILVMSRAKRKRNSLCSWRSATRNLLSVSQR